MLDGLLSELLNAILNLVNQLLAGLGGLGG
jgi:hypothetical protein